MDERSCKIMSMFFKVPCEGHAVVVEEDHANIAIIDTRFEHSKQILEQSLAQGKMRAIIVLSSQSVDRIHHDKIMYLDKPITANPMFEALDWAKDISEGKQRSKPPHAQRVSTPPKTAPAPPTHPIVASTPELVLTQTEAPPSDIIEEPAEAASQNTQPTEAAHQHTETTASASSAPVSMQMEESDFADQIGTVVDVDLDDPVKQRTATYDPDKYYQGFVQRAFSKAHEGHHALQLTLGWNPLIVFPQNRQIWWDADDKLLKAVSDIEININTAVATAVDQNQLDESSMTPDKKQDMDTFLWKLTLWSSRGRYPQSIDIDSPIQLKRWPNFTRYIVTPHALRITALLIKEGPDTMIGIANALNIELRYVSIFVSATNALGLIRQIPSPKIDEILMPVPRNKPSQQKRSILNKIINKLLGR
jgi:hypothetical protein